MHSIYCKYVPNNGPKKLVSVDRQLNRILVNGPQWHEKVDAPFKANSIQGDIRANISVISGFRLLCSHAIMADIYILKN